MRRSLAISVIAGVTVAIGCFLLFHRRGDHVLAQSNPYDLTITGSFRFHKLRLPTGLIVEESASSGLLIYIADTGNNVIRLFSGTSLFTFAGNGTAGYVNGPLNSAEFNAPTGISGGYYTENLHGTIYNWHHLQVNDTGNFVIREICDGNPPPTQGGSCYSVQTDTLAGSGIKGFVNGPSSSARFSHVSGFMGAGGFIVDSDNNVIRSLSGTTVSTYAGTGAPGLVNGSLATAKFNTPTKIIADSAGNLFVVDAGNHCIRKISNGVVSTFAGSGQAGYADGSATTAKFYRPTSVVYNPADGYYYVADTFNNCIRRVDSSGNVTTYAGASTAGYQDGGLLSARFNKPTDLGIANGYMYVSDTHNNAIRQIDMVHGTVVSFID